MLDYARMHRPAAVVIENVDEPAAVANITAAVLSIREYTWRTLESDARMHGPMARKRLFWIGTRAAGPS